MPRDQIISLGWIYTAKKPPVNDDVISLGYPIGQTWSGEFQPSIMVPHAKASSNNFVPAQWLRPEALEHLVTKSGIGLWHLAWAIPAAFFVLSSFNDVWGIIAGIGAATAFAVSIYRKAFQLRKQMKAFSSWYSNEISQFKDKASALTQSIISQF